MDYICIKPLSKMNNENTCANCGHEITQNFCPHCGQKKYKRIDGKYIKDEIQYTLLHTNKGFFYTIKNLIKNPGKTTREYLRGNRVNHYKPILLAFVMTGITVFITYKILKAGDLMSDYFAGLSAQNPKRPFNYDSINTFLANYTSFFTMLLIPFAAAVTWLFFRKQGHNYYEHIVISSFLYIVWSLFSIFLIYPLMYIFHTPNIFISIMILSIPAFLPVAGWFFKGLYPEQSVGKIALKIFLMAIVSLFIYIVLSLTISIIFLLPKIMEAANQANQTVH